MKCKNKVEQTVPKGWDYKIVEMDCGNTSIYGDTLYCSDCAEKNAKRGHAPNECKHGRNIWDEFCNACEFGE
jgi:hypothetical protein